MTLDMAYNAARDHMPCHDFTWSDMTCDLICVMWHDQTWNEVWHDIKCHEAWNDMWLDIWHVTCKVWQ